MHASMSKGHDAIEKALKDLPLIKIQDNVVHEFGRCGDVVIKMSYIACKLHGFVQIQCLSLVNPGIT